MSDSQERDRARDLDVAVLELLQSLLCFDLADLYLVWAVGVR